VRNHSSFHQQLRLQEQTWRLGALHFGGQPAYDSMKDRPCLRPHPALRPQPGQVGLPPDRGDRWDRGGRLLPESHAELHPPREAPEGCEQRVPAPIQPVAQFGFGHHGTGGAGQERAPLGGGGDHPGVSEGRCTGLGVGPRPG
jgi:hypothetical protein